MPSHVIAALLLALFVFPPDETLRRYGADDRTWHLETLNGRPFDANATVTFPARNMIRGQAPCNRYTSTNTTPYPWFDAGPIVATRMACPDLAAEQAFFAALEAATLAIVEDNTLTLSDDTDTLLVFTARD